jgi:hypothetical protein
MTNIGRDQWLRSLRDWKPLPNERVYKLTMQQIATLMSPAGVISKPRKMLLEYAQVPERTLERHLRWAVENGWLTHVRKGVKRTAAAVYEAALPPPDHPPRMASDELSTIRHARRVKTPRPSATYSRLVVPRPSATYGGLYMTTATNPNPATKAEPADQTTAAGTGIFVRTSDGFRLHLALDPAFWGKSDLTIGRPTRPLRHSPVTAGLLSDVDLGSAPYVSGVQR